MPVPIEGLEVYSDTLATYFWGGLYIDLISSSFDPDDPALVLADLTIASWSGYSTVTMPSLTGSMVSGDFWKRSTSTPAAFANASGSSQTAYGYLIRTSTKLVGVEAYPSPVSIPDGQSLYQTIDLYTGNLVLP